MAMSIYLAELIRLTLGLTLLWAAWGKTSGYSVFVANLSESFYFPHAIATFTAPLLILLEWALALVLIVKLEPLTLAMYITLTLFISFTAMIIFAHFRDQVVKCNCFGEQHRPVSQFDMIRNLILILSCVYYLQLMPAQLTATPLMITPSEHGLLLLSATVTSLIGVYFHDIVHTLLSKEQG
jgi:hypothetical protein